LIPGLPTTLSRPRGHRISAVCGGNTVRIRGHSLRRNQ